MTSKTAVTISFLVAIISVGYALYSLRLLYLNPPFNNLDHQDKYKTICRYLETEIGFTQATVSFKPSAELSKELRDRRTRNNRIDSNWEQQKIRNEGWELLVESNRNLGPIRLRDYKNSSTLLLSKESLDFAENHPSMRVTQEPCGGQLLEYANRPSK